MRDHLDTNPIPVITSRFGRWAYRWLPREEKKRAALIGTVAFVLGMVGPQLLGFPITGTMQSLQERGSFYNIVAQIDSYRQYPDIVKCSPQIAASITGMNARIAAEHESNQHWYTDYFSTDRWNTVQPIALPCELTEARQ